MTKFFRLTNKPGGLGLSCTREGLSLAGVPLLCKTERGFTPRPLDEIEALFACCDPGWERPPRLPLSLGIIAEALNRGDLTYAGIAAVITRIRN